MQHYATALCFVHCIYFTCANISVDVPPIYDGEPMTDRKSKFQAHLAPVSNKEQVNHSTLVPVPNCDSLADFGASILHVYLSVCS